MKKLLSLIMSMVILMGMSCISVKAESIPIKKIDSDNRAHYALLENGVLVKADEIIPTAKSEVIAEDVSDFHAESIPISGRLTILFNDGTLKKEITSDLDFEVADTNVDQILNDTVYLKNGTVHSLDNKYTYANIKKLLDYSDATIYALDNNDTLFACVNGKKIKIADDVLYYDKKNKRIFNKNNEILSFDLDINKGTAQLNLLTNQVSYKNFQSCNPVTNDNKVISYSKDSSRIIDGPQNVYQIAYYESDSYIYYLSLDNKLMLYNKYYSSYPLTAKYGANRELYDGETFKYASRYFAIGTDNNLYRFSPYIGKNKTIIDTDVDKILFYDNPVYLNSIIYQKNNGEIYYYNQGGKPFLYPLAQKQNKVIFNGDEIELEDNIQIKDGRSMYPFRAILEAMGASVMWDGANQKAIGTLNGSRVEFKIGTDEYIVNGEMKHMDTQSYVDSITNKTYIPIRYVAEALGFTVDWQPGDMENTITIKN